MNVAHAIMKRLPVNSTQCRSCGAIGPWYAHYCAICGERTDARLTRTVVVTQSATLLLPLVALVLWVFSLHEVNIRRMTDLGLVSVFPPSIIVALVVLSVSFCLELNQANMRAPVIAVHVLLLIVMLYAVTALVEEAPRFNIVYRHEGYIDYILRTGTVNPNLDAYFSWPGFFLFSAALTSIAGYHDIFSFAAWSPVFFNVIYLGPLYVLLTTTTWDTRIIWLAIWLFYLANWIGQDYFSPQGLNFFLYLVILALLLKWFKNPSPAPKILKRERLQRLLRRWPLIYTMSAWMTVPDIYSTPLQPAKRPALLASILAIFALMVFSHPLTPGLTIASVLALTIFRRCKPFWLPLVMILMSVLWLLFMTEAYLAGHLVAIVSDIGHLGGAINANVTSRVVAGNPEHALIAELRIVMTLCIWGLGFVGAVLRLRKGYRDFTSVLLAVAPFPLFVVQTYGGEMLMRIYLFTLPFMAFFAASIFYSLSYKRPSLWLKVATVPLCLVFLGGFLFTRYGNERMDYMTNAEVAGVRHLYAIAPLGSLFVAGWDGTPWQFEDYEQYSNYALSDDPHLSDAVAHKNVHAIVQFIDTVNAPRVYVIFTRSQKATAQALGLPPNTLDQLQQMMLTSRKFVSIYSTADAQILLYVGERKGG